MISAKVKNIEIDENGNYKVITEYKDGSGNLIQEGTTRYSLSVVPDVQAVFERLKADISIHSQSLLLKSYFKNKDFKLKDNLDKLQDLVNLAVGHTTQHTETQFDVGNKTYTIDEVSVKSVTEKV